MDVTRENMLHLTLYYGCYTWKYAPFYSILWMLHVKICPILLYIMDVTRENMPHFTLYYGCYTWKIQL